MIKSNCDRMLVYDYIRRYNEVIRCIHWVILNKYRINNFINSVADSVFEFVANENIGIRVDTRMKTDILINTIYLTYSYIVRKEIGITNLGLITQAENVKLRKYGILKKIYH